MFRLVTAALDSLGAIVAAIVTSTHSAAAFSHFRLFSLSRARAALARHAMLWGGIPVISDSFICRSGPMFVTPLRIIDTAPVVRPKYSANSVYVFSPSASFAFAITSP